MVELERTREKGGKKPDSKQIPADGHRATGKEEETRQSVYSRIHTRTYTYIL